MAYNIEMELKDMNLRLSKGRPHPVGFGNVELRSTVGHCLRLISSAGY